jgi:hypothetical protein
MLGAENMGSEARDPAGGNHKFSAHFRLILRPHFRMSFRSYAGLVWFEHSGLALMRKWRLKRGDGTFEENA